MSRSGYYAWVKRSATLISADELNLYRRAKTLFNASRQSLGSRELMKKLREEGFTIGRHRTKTLMRKLDLKVTQRLALIRTGFPRHFLDSLNIVVHTPLAGHDHYACVGALGCRTSRYN